MAGRGKQNNLQIELKTEEEWCAQMQRTGLTVVDVYTAWCGPCKAIQGLFRKIRNEQQDDFLCLAVAETDKIDSLMKYKGRSEPTFMFYGSKGHLVHVMRGVDGPLITKVIGDLIAKERKVADGSLPREKKFIDRVVATDDDEPEESEEVNGEEEEEGGEGSEANVDDVEGEENLAEELTRRKSAGSVLKLQTVTKTMTVGLLTPDVTKDEGMVGQITEAIITQGFELLKTVQRQLTSEEANGLLAGSQHEGDTTAMVEMLTSAPCTALAITKPGDDTAEHVRHEFAAFVGPADTTAEEATDSLRARFATDSLPNPIMCVTSVENVDQYLQLFFPELSIPTIKQEVPQTSLQRTIAIIRPHVLHRKDEIMQAIGEHGFLVSMQKEVTLLNDVVEKMYEQNEFYENLVYTMTSGPCVVLCLAKSNAVQAWKDIVSVGGTDAGNGGDEMISLQKQFASPDNPCDPLHASNSIAQFEQEKELLFPCDQAVLFIQPDIVSADKSRLIISWLKRHDIQVVTSKQVTLTAEQVPAFCGTDTSSDSHSKIVEHVTSGAMLCCIVTGEDCTYRLPLLIGHTDPDVARSEDGGSTIRGEFGVDNVRNAVYANTSAEYFVEIVKQLLPELELTGDGKISTDTTSTDDKENIPPGNNEEQKATPTEENNASGVEVSGIETGGECGNGSVGNTDTGTNNDEENAPTSNHTDEEGAANQVEDASAPAPTEEQAVEPPAEDAPAE